MRIKRAFLLFLLILLGEPLPAQAWFSWRWPSWFKRTPAVRPIVPTQAGPALPQSLSPSPALNQQRRSLLGMFAYWFLPVSRDAVEESVGEAEQRLQERVGEARGTISQEFQALHRSVDHAHSDIRKANESIINLQVNLKKLGDCEAGNELLKQHIHEAEQILRQKSKDNVRKIEALNERSRSILEQIQNERVSLEAMRHDIEGVRARTAASNAALQRQIAEQAQQQRERHEQIQMSLRNSEDQVAARQRSIHQAQTSIRDMRTWFATMHQEQAARARRWQAMEDDAMEVAQNQKRIEDLTVKFMGLMAVQQQQLSGRPHARALLDDNNQ